MKDKILESFLRHQFEAGMDLARQSEILELIPVSGDPPYKYIVRFKCQGMVQTAHGDVEKASGFTVGIRFPPDYLRSCEPAQIVTWLEPLNIYHPNILPPFVCMGHIAPGTDLVSLLFYLYDIIRYAIVTPVESNALNKAACQWYRAHCEKGLFPTDNRPLKGSMPQAFEEARAIS